MNPKLICLIPLLIMSVPIVRAAHIVGGNLGVGLVIYSNILNHFVY
jgi:hypothetical protein